MVLEEEPAVGQEDPFLGRVLVGKCLQHIHPVVFDPRGLEELARAEGRGVKGGGEGNDKGKKMVPKGVVRVREAVFKVR